MSRPISRLAPAVRRASSRMITPEPQPTSSTLSPGTMASASSKVRTTAMYPERPRSSRLATLPSSAPPRVIVQ